MKSVWKFPLRLASIQVLEMPDRAELLTVQMQNGDPVLWALVDPDAERADRRILLVGTGDSAATHGRFIATVQDGAFVWHFFDVDAEAVAS